MSFDDINTYAHGKSREFMYASPTFLEIILCNTMTMYLLLATFLYYTEQECALHEGVPTAQKSLYCALPAIPVAVVGSFLYMYLKRKYLWGL